MPRNTNTVFYEFEYTLFGSVDTDDFKSMVNKIGINGSDITINVNGINYSIPRILLIDSTPTIPDRLKGNNIFHFRIVKSLDKGIYSSNLDYSDFDENLPRAGNIIEKNEGEFIIDREFQFILKLNYDSQNHTVKGIISYPRISGFITKDTLKTLLKKVLDSTFEPYNDDELNIQNFGMKYVYKEMDFDTLLSKAIELKFNQRFVIDDKYRGLLELEEETDEIEKKVIIKEKTSIIKHLKIFKYLQDNNIEDKNFLIDDIKVLTSEGSFNFEGGLCSTYGMNLKFNDGNLESGFKDLYITNISEFIHSL